MAKVSIQPDRFLVTQPVVLLSCWGKDRKPNIITLAWTGVICSDPPLVYASIRPSRYSYGLLKENGDFVINVPSKDQVREVDLCGVVSGRDEDKFALCGFTAERAAKVNAPLIAECSVNLECETRQVLELGVHHVFIGEVVNLQAAENIVVGKSRIDDSAFQPLAYATGPRHYHETGRIEGAYYGFSKSSKPPWEKG